MKDKLEAGDVEKINSALEELKATLKDENATKEQIDDKVKTLTEASHKLAEAMYAKDQNTQGGNAGNTSGGKKGKDDDVIDAEVE